MKPTIPETGTVLSTHGDTAEIMLSGGHSCKGCGAGQIGLCRARGDSMMMTLKNDAGAAAGDTVLIGIDRKVQVSGYLLAYLIPLLSFIAGSLCGHFAGDYFSMPALDVAAGFSALLLASFLSFRRLRKLDSSYRMVIKRVLNSTAFTVEVKSDEERRYEKYASSH